MCGIVISVTSLKSFKYSTIFLIICFTIFVALVYGLIFLYVKVFFSKFSKIFNTGSFITDVGKVLVFQKLIWFPIFFWETKFFWGTKNIFWQASCQFLPIWLSFANLVFKKSFLFLKKIWFSKKKNILVPKFAIFKTELAKKLPNWEPNFVCGRIDNIWQNWQN